MTKVICIEMPNGWVFEVSAQIIINDRAKTLATSDSSKGLGAFDEIFTAESFPDDSDILDWLKNNMNWSDIEAKVVEAFRPTGKPNFHLLFSDADCTIVD